MPTELFTTSSGREITVNVSDEGEPESISFNYPENESPNVVTLSENEIDDISTYLEEYDDE